MSDYLFCGGVHRRPQAAHKKQTNKLKKKACRKSFQLGLKIPVEKKVYIVLWIPDNFNFIQFTNFISCLS